MIKLLTIQLSLNDIFFATYYTQDKDGSWQEKMVEKIQSMDDAECLLKKVTSRIYMYILSCHNYLYNKFSYAIMQKVKSSLAKVSTILAYAEMHAERKRKKLFVSSWFLSRICNIFVT